MYKEKTVLAIIPARGGSKRLPGKNKLDLFGKPLIAWTIDAAINSKVFDEVMVSTDDKEIAEIAIKHSASIPFMRSENLSTDTASSLDVVEDIITLYKHNNKHYDIVVLLQPTSPLRDSDDIVNALDTFVVKEANSVLSVCEVDHPLQWCNSLDETLSMESFLKVSVKNSRSQNLETYYRLNGAIYIWDVDSFLQKKESILPPSFATIMPRERSVDIDEKIDFLLAEALLNDEGGA